MKIETITNPVTGQVVELCTARGWTGNPEFSKFYPGDENKRSRYVTYLLATDDNTGERIVLRVNFWNGIGEAAHKALEGRSALIELNGCRVSHYVDRYGSQRFSVNVNREADYTVLDFQPFVAAGTGFKEMVDMARRPAAATAEETSEVPF
ncbi:MAG: hypothetical protein EA399_00685 [Desulfovibrionales bacterium]|nr:MAG: hypothetical protein EA399_00685 [Desulfovibrionales bacterium]